MIIVIFSEQRTLNGWWLSIIQQLRGGGWL